MIEIAGENVVCSSATIARLRTDLLWITKFALLIRCASSFRSCLKVKARAGVYLGTQKFVAAATDGSHVNLQDRQRRWDCGCHCHIEAHGYRSCSLRTRQTHKINGTSECWKSAMGSSTEITIASLHSHSQGFHNSSECTIGHCCVNRPSSCHPSL